MKLWIPQDTRNKANGGVNQSKIYGRELCNDVSLSQGYKLRQIVSTLSHLTLETDEEYTS